MSNMIHRSFRFSQQINTYLINFLLIDELTNQLFSSSSVSHQSFESKQSFDEFIVIKLYMMTLLFILKVENCVTLMISGGCDWSSMLDQPPVVKAVDQSGKHTS